MFSIGNGIHVSYKSTRISVYVQVFGRMRWPVNFVSRNVQLEGVDREGVVLFLCSRVSVIIYLYMYQEGKSIYESIL